MFDQEFLEKIGEGRKLLEALKMPTANKSDLDVLAIMAGVGLAHLRAMKVSQDLVRATEEMARRIQAGPRPSPEEAGLN